ncbi:MAG: hypothetical protein J7605_08625 [Variovorax sp.]|nr:hypothetical protein [Variovorax sp.]
MTNPWLTSNPFMSMWLSACNQMMGAARGLAMAEFQRQTAAMQAEFEKQVVDFWTGGWLRPQQKARRR